MTTKRTRSTLTRRKVLKTSSAAGLALAAGSLAAPALAQERSLRVGCYGGFFEDSFKEHVYPAFTEATGIEIEPVTQPDSTSFVQTMQQAIAAGNAPTDLTMHVPQSVVKATNIGGQFMPLDPAKIPNLKLLDPAFLQRDGDDLVAVAVLAYFTSLVVNTNEVDPLPTSWADLWDTDRFEASLGLPKLSNSPLLEITAETFFGGQDILQTQEGIQKVFDKIAELKPNVALWYSAESQMEQALKNEDVIGGMYYHDVAGLMAADGLPIASLFPKEGNPIDYSAWTLTTGSEKSDEAHEFVNFTCDPKIQAKMTRFIGVAPVVDRALTDLTDDEFNAASGAPVIRESTDVKINQESFIEEAFNRMLAS